MPTRPRRPATQAAAATLLAASLAPAWAAPPPIPPRQGTPPARVGRLARIAGAVSHHTADADQWSQAVLNLPVTSGDSFWTEPAARADIQVASSRMVLAPATELDVTVLDVRALTAAETQGELYLELRAIPGGDTYTIQTPRGLVQIATSGRYAIVAGDADHPTLVTVVDGSAQIIAGATPLQVGPHQTATITGSDPTQGSVGPQTEDAFLAAMLAEDRPVRRTTAPIPRIVASMTGAEDLQSEGDWTETTQYGAVWYPPVQADWVPYREGRWSYVGPWGWTWIDQSPWGFAPFHYGRWAQIDNRWGWVPVSPGGYAEPSGPYAVPVYAPALVGFIGLGAAIGVAASVGWVPLGPREPYYPPYRANLEYVRGLNATTVLNVRETINQTNIVNNRTTIIQQFANRGAATVVPAATMLRSSPVAGASRPLPAEAFGHTQASFRPPVNPAAATVGVTPAIARQFNFIAPRLADPRPGPAIARPGLAGPFSTPALRTAAPNTAAPSATANEAPHPPGPDVRPGSIPGPLPAGPPRTEPRALPSLSPQPPRPTAPPLASQATAPPPKRPEPQVRPFVPAPRSAAPQPGLAPRPVPADLRPLPQARPPAPPPGQPNPPAFRPNPPAFRPPPPAFRPPVFQPPAFHPSAPPPAFHPAPPPRPEPRPAPPPRPPAGDPHRR